MSFVAIDELFSGRTGSFTDGAERQWTRRFRVRTSSNQIGPIEVMFAPGIPRLYDAYFSFRTTEVDLLALCRRVTPTQDDDDWQVWIVECEYSTESRASGQPEGAGGAAGGDPRNGGGDNANNPEIEPPNIEFGSHIREIAFSKDAEGRAVVNSALQPFDPLPTIEDGWDVLTLERNEPHYDRKAMSKFGFKVNLGFFLGEAPGTVLCRPITARQAYRGPLKYWRVRYEFHFANEQMQFDWRMRLLDQGLCQLKQTQGAAATTATPRCPSGAAAGWAFQLSGFLPPMENLNGNWFLAQTAPGADSWTGSGTNPDGEPTGIVATLAYDVLGVYTLTFGGGITASYYADAASWNCNGFNAMQYSGTGVGGPGVMIGGGINPALSSDSNGATGHKIVPIMAHGQAVGQPVPLNGNGLPLSLIKRQRGQFVYIDFARYKFADFGPLRITL